MKMLPGIGLDRLNHEMQSRYYSSKLRIFSATLIQGWRIYVSEINMTLLNRNEFNAISDGYMDDSYLCPPHSYRCNANGLCKFGLYLFEPFILSFQIAVI